MQDDTRGVEAELQQIEDEFASGRMNAFGSTATQDAFLSELHQIADIETQVFYRMCRILKNSKEDEHAILTGMFATACEPSPASTSGQGAPGGASTDNGALSSTTPNAAAASLTPGLDHSINLTAMRSSSIFDPTTTALGSGVNMSNNLGMASGSGLNSTVAGERASSSTASGTAAAAVARLRSSEWCRDGEFADKAFEDVAAHFAALQSDFDALGDNLRHLSKHVIQLNEMSEQMNTMP